MQLRKSQILASVILASSMIFAPMMANAGGNHQHNYMQASYAKYQKHNFKHMSKLDLSQEQKDQMFKIRHEQQAAVYEQKKLIKAAKQELRAANTDDGLDAAKAKQAANSLGQAKGELALLRAKSRADMMAVLTPEQKQKIADFKASKSVDKK